MLQSRHFPERTRGDCVQALLGSVESIVETLQQRREQYGLNYLTVDAGFMEPMAPIVARLAGT